LESGDELPNIALPTNPILKGIQAMRPPSGATADRSNTPTNGDFRYNQTLGCHEGYTPDGWVRMSNIIIAAYRGNVGQTSGTTRIPLDNTPPLVTEGTQLWTKAVTPTIVGSVMSIEFSCISDSSNTGSANIFSLFRDNTLIAVASATSAGAGGNKPGQVSLIYNDTTTSLAAVTYQVRVGNEAGTWYVGRGSGATFGGTTTSGWKIDEVLT
jgi:hypothetical protein